MIKSSYQKLKEENARLKSDIYMLVMEPDSFHGASVKAGYEMKFDFENLCLLGANQKMIRVNLLN
jgi:hypothetical protein